VPHVRTPEEIAAIVFIDMAVIIFACRLVRALMKRIGQPAVVGEVIAGILLGPSLLGAFPGHLTTRLFPVDVQPYLNVVAQLGLIMFMFTVGLELDTKLVEGKLRTVSVISLSSVALPFGLGIVLAEVIYSSHKVVTTGSASHVVKLLPFSLFLAASLSVTAFPLLARILTERGINRTTIGSLTLACGAVDDILAWSILAVVLGVVHSTGIGDLGRLVGESVAFVAVMFIVVKPRLTWLAVRYRQEGTVTPDVMAVVLIGFLVSSYITAEIGINVIFGAFLFGVVMPRQDTRELFHDILGRLEQVSVLLLLPVFFVVTGLDTNVRALGGKSLVQLPLILVIAITGKFVGAAVAARVQGVAPKRSIAIGTLMNTRGLTGLVILNVGLSAGVLDSKLFTMLVLMCVLTTLMTGPLLSLVYPEKEVMRDIAEAERAASGVVDAYRVLLLVDEGADTGPLLELASALAASERPSEVVLTRFSSSPRSLELGSGLETQGGLQGQSLDQMLESLEELRGLASRLHERGVACTVRSQFSDDLARDLLTQASALEADIVLVGVDPVSSRTTAKRADDVATWVRLLNEAPCAVGLVSSRSVGGRLTIGPGLAVAVAGERDHGLAALELALRLARAGQVSLEIAGETRQSRQLSRWIRQAEHVGFRLESPATVSGAGGTAGGAPGRPAVLLTGRDNRKVDRESLTRVLAEIDGSQADVVILVGAGDGTAERSLERFLGSDTAASGLEAGPTADSTAGAEGGPPAGIADSPEPAGTAPD
jgi:Kef-type K+ transport system membrane component KefB